MQPLAPVLPSVHAQTPAPELELAPQPTPRPTNDSPRPAVLLVEDNPGDVRLVREVLSKGTLALHLAIARDGLEALRVLRVSRKKPDLILLDLNLPGMDGRTLLHRIKSDPDLLRIPVVVVSGSDSLRDVTSAYSSHANCYLVKPADLQSYERVLRHLVEFWIGVARLPDA